tara:strand:- start:7592 stop:8590 length:999 start_codon:yes stop_codon:yes gene_type:complete
MRHFHVFILTLGFFFSPVQAQTIDFHFQLFELDDAIADALQPRLIDGGPTAAQTMAKMQDFVRQRRVGLEADFNIQTASGQRAKGTSSQKTLELEDEREVTDGLQIELDPVLDASASVVDLNLAAEYAQRDGGDVKIRRLTTSSLLKVGIPALLTRWQEGDEILFLIVTATHPGPQSAPAKPNRQIFIDAAMYESDADAQAQRDPVARVVFPSRSGQRARNEISVPMFFETGGGLEVHNLGYHVEVDPVIGVDGSTIDLAASLSHGNKRGGSERLADGTRLPKVEIRTSNASQQLTDGQSKLSAVLQTTLGGAQSAADTWKANLGVKIQTLQ